MADHVRCGRLPAFAQERHEVDPRDAALLRDGAQLRVRAVARVVVLRGAARVRERDRLLRSLDRVGCGLAPAVAEIHEDAERVHALDGLDARLAEPRIGRLEAAVAEQVPAVVGRLHDAKAEAMQLVEPRQVGLEGDTILEAVDQARAPRLLRRPDVGHGADAGQHFGMAVDLRLHLADVDHGLREGRVRRRRADRPQRQVHTGEPGIPDILKLCVRQGPVRLGIPEAAEPVDHDRALVHVGAGRPRCVTKCHGDRSGGACGNERTTRHSDHRYSLAPWAHVQRTR